MPEQMKHITSNDELVVGKFYWCREKTYPFMITLQQCKKAGWKYLGDGRMWAEEHNSQALAYWDVVGPIADMTEAIFNAILADESHLTEIK